MQTLTEILSQIIQEAVEQHFDDTYEAILFEDTRLFQELSNPDFAYDYEEESPNIWVFSDRYGNRIGVRFNLSTRFLDSYYVAKDLRGREVDVFDAISSGTQIDPLSFQGGSDQHRSDTICKILRDEILPKYLLKSRPSIIKIHPLNTYRDQIFWKCAEICKEKYPQIEIKRFGNEILILYK